MNKKKNKFVNVWIQKNVRANFEITKVLLILT